MNDTNAASFSKVLTLPNLLSIFRIILIPLLVWAYCIQRDSWLTAFLLLISGVTDSLDGLIARKCHMISNLGKALDPIADKLTQGTMLLCLITRFPLMIVPFILLLVKEAAVGISSLAVIRKTGSVHGAVWHGKMTTCMLYAMMTIHVVFPNLSTTLSTALIAVCTAMMLLSFVMYLLRNIYFLKQSQEGKHEHQTTKK